MNIVVMNSIFNEEFWDKQCFLDHLVAKIYSLKEFSNTLTNFPYALLTLPH